MKSPSRWATALAFILLLISRPGEAQMTRAKVKQELVDKKSSRDAQHIDSVKHGVVTTENADEFLPGVNVVRKGTTQGTVTDAEGKFEMVIDHPKSTETLVASFIGFTTFEREVLVDSTMKEVKISMNYDIQGSITLGTITVDFGGD